MKTCFCCKITKECNLFFKHAQTPDGLHSWCKTCCNVGNQKSRDKVNSTIEGRAKVFLQNAKKSAIKRKQEFNLKVSDVVNCWDKQSGICPYSGIKMTLEAGKLNTVSIERIDSNIGYTETNTILICRAINTMKSNFMFEDFYMLCKSVTQFLGDDKLNLSVGAYK
tara:strand:+ start:60 stop:557 length:498 start_codon:yes stop_codon:yes gene_type:complete